MPRRRPLPPAPEPPPEGQVWRRSNGKYHLVTADYVTQYHQAIMDGRIWCDVPNWRHDPTYNLRRRRKP